MLSRKIRLQSISDPSSWDGDHHLVFIVIHLGKFLFNKLCYRETFYYNFFNINTVITALWRSFSLQRLLPAAFAEINLCSSEVRHKWKRQHSDTSSQTKTFRVSEVALFQIPPQNRGLTMKSIRCPLSLCHRLSDLHNHILCVISSVNTRWLKYPSILDFKQI